MIEFGRAEPGLVGIKFHNETTGQDMVVKVIDKFPSMGDVHVEGRRYVEVSVEMFIALVATIGYEPVVPGEDAGEE